MSYLARLKAEFSEKRPAREPTKPTKAPFRQFCQYPRWAYPANRRGDSTRSGAVRLRGWIRGRSGGELCP